MYAKVAVFFLINIGSSSLAFSIISPTAKTHSHVKNRSVKMNLSNSATSPSPTVHEDDALKEIRSPSSHSSMAEASSDSHVSIGDKHISSRPPTEVESTRTNNTDTGNRASSSTNTNTSTSDKKVIPLHPKQITKRILACGNDYTAALSILYASQPFLKWTVDNNEGTSTTCISNVTVLPPAEEFKGPFDAKPICGIINLLSRTKQYSLATDLLNRVIKLHANNKIPTYYLLAVEKSIIGMLAEQRLHRQILRHVYHDIPYYTKQPPPMDVYHCVMSALGKCRKIDSMLDLLSDLESEKSIIAQIGDGDGDGDSIRTHPYTSTDNSTGTFQYNLPPPDRMAYLTVLTGSIRCKASHQSVEIMNRMMQKGMKPDKVVFNHVLSSLANTKTEGRYETAKKIWVEMEKEGICIDATYKTLIRLFSKENQWEDVAAVKERMMLQNSGMADSFSSTGASVINDALTPLYIKDLEKLEKVLKNVKKPWYKLGTVKIPTREGNVLEVLFGVQTHRNPVLNGLSLVFYDPSGEKLGFMLIRNDLEKQSRNGDSGSSTGDEMFYSSILGMLVDEKHRGKGLAKIFIGIWLQICLNSDAFPRSEKINKPLLSLVLSNFGFIPTSDSAIEVQISPIANVPEDQLVNAQNLSWKPLFALYSRTPLNFGERELRIQKMAVARYPITPKGKTTAVRTIFEHPMAQRARLGEDYSKEAADLSSLLLDLWAGTRKSSCSNNKDQRHSRNCENETGINFFIDHQLLKRVMFGYLF